MQSHQLRIEKTAHYYTIGEPSDRIRHLWFALHGYGQLASQLIYKFEELGEESLIVAPEGLSRFYWDDHRNYHIVGASWMTKQDRLVEIADYCAYLQQLYDHYTQQLRADVRIHLLGFSQGGATLVRWLMRNAPAADSVLLWGCGFPTDLDYKPVLDYWNSKQLFVINGTEDPLISMTQIQEHQVFIEQQGLQCQYRFFEGKHEIDRAVLRQIAQELDKR